MKHKKIILGILILSWLFLTVLWHDDALELFKKEEPVMMSMRVEEAPVNDSISTNQISLQTILTSLVALINAVFGAIYMVQKVMGKR